MTIRQETEGEHATRPDSKGADVSPSVSMAHRKQKRPAGPKLSPKMMKAAQLLIAGKTPRETIIEVYNNPIESKIRDKTSFLFASSAFRAHLQELGWTDPAEVPILTTDRDRLEQIRDLNMELARNRALTAGERASASKLARDAMRDLQALGNTAPVGEYPELQGFVESCKRSGLLKKSTVDKPTPHNPSVQSAQH